VYLAIPAKPEGAVLVWGPAAPAGGPDTEGAPLSRMQGAVLVWGARAALVADFAASARASVHCR
jgi:hypothetical protein